MRGFQQLIFFGGHHIYPDNCSGELGLILDKRANQLIRHSIAILIVLLTASIAYTIYPFSLYLLYGEHVHPVPLVVPFFNPNDDIGYYTSLAIQLSIGIGGVIGNIGTELLFAAILNGMWAATDVIEHTMQQISRSINKHISAMERKRQIHDLMLQMEDLDRFGIVTFSFKIKLNPRTNTRIVQYLNFVCLFFF